MGKTFQATQLTNERFLTPANHFFDICQTELPWTSGLRYATYCTDYTPEVGESSVWQISKQYFAESMVKNLSCASCAAWNVFPINSLLTPSSHFIAYFLLFSLKKNFMRTVRFPSFIKENLMKVHHDEIPKNGANLEFSIVKLLHRFLLSLSEHTT